MVAIFDGQSSRIMKHGIGAGEALYSTARSLAQFIRA